MSELKKNADGTVTISAAQLKLLVEAYNQKTEDIERAVMVIAGVLKTLGIINKDGTFKDDFRFRHMLQSLMKIVGSATIGGADSLNKQFGFVVDPGNVEMMERYAYLYNDELKSKEQKSLLHIDPKTFE